MEGGDCEVEGERGKGRREGERRDCETSKRERKGEGEGEREDVGRFTRLAGPGQAGQARSSLGLQLRRAWRGAARRPILGASRKPLFDFLDFGPGPGPVAGVRARRAPGDRSAGPREQVLGSGQRGESTFCVGFPGPGLRKGVPGPAGSGPESPARQQ